MRIRQATAADSDALAACITAAYAPFLQAGLTLPPVADGIAEDIRNNHVWVAEDAGQLIGGVVLVLGDTAHLANLAVHPDAGGHGVGRALIAQAVAVARAAGYGAIRLTTHVQMTGTQAFYRRLGWIEAGREGEKVYFLHQL